MALRPHRPGLPVKGASVPCPACLAAGLPGEQAPGGPPAVEPPLPGDGVTQLVGSGDALLSAAGRFAKAQQRADPARAEHFGG